MGLMNLEKAWVSVGPFVKDFIYLDRSIAGTTAVSGNKKRN